MRKFVYSIWQVQLNGWLYETNIQIFMWICVLKVKKYFFLFISQSACLLSISCLEKKEKRLSKATICVLWSAINQTKSCCSNWYTITSIHHCKIAKPQRSTRQNTTFYLPTMSTNYQHNSPIFRLQRNQDCQTCINA